MLLHAAERYVYNQSGAPGAIGESGDSQVHSFADTSNAAATWLAELTRQLLHCERVGIARLIGASARLRLIATSGIGVEERDSWWHMARRAIVDRYKQDLAESPPFMGSLQFLGTYAMAEGMPAETWHTGLSVIGERSLLFSSIRMGERVIAILIVDGVDEAHTSLPQILPLVRATAKVGALILGERVLRREQAQLQARITQMERERDTLDEVVATIAHEVRQPLTSMRLSVQLANRQVERVRQQEAWSGWAGGSLNRATQYLLLANRQTSKGERLLQDLVDMTRLRTAELPVFARACDLDVVARESIAALRASAPERVLHLTLPQEPVYVNADPDRISQVIENYVSNALEYSPSDQPVEIRGRILREAVRLEVRDHGPGVAHADQARVWERFVRLDPQVAESESPLHGGGGLGLGLYLCRQIISMHGGEVGVESAPAEGATFWFALPLLAAHDVVAETV